MGGHYENDIMRQLQEVLARCDKLDKKVDDTKTAWKKEVKQIKSDFAVERKQFKGKIKELETELTTVKTENKKLKKRVVELETENSKLRSQLNNDSTNSSLPPSTDQKGKRANTYNSREKSNKTSGGQCGHKGKTLTAEKIKRKIESGDLKHSIVEIGSTDKPYAVRYVVDFDITAIVKELHFHADENGKIIIPEEYRAVVTYGEVIKAMAVQLYSEGVVSNDRICEFLNSISDNKIEIATGSVYNFIKNFSKRSEEKIAEITEKLKESEVVYTDATNITVNGKQAYMRNQSTEEVVLYSAMNKKSKEEIEEKTVLKDYEGILIHDHETSMYSYGTKHGECIVHLLRYLKKNTEETKNDWSDKLTGFFVMLNKERKSKKEKGEWFSSGEYTQYSCEYDKIVKRGYKQNGTTESKYAKAEEIKLLNRLKKYKENHLMFVKDNRVSFDNNLSERDLRKCKNRQKMAGGFRTETGHEMYCRILSVIETCKRRKENIFEYIKGVFAKAPVSV